MTNSKKSYLTSLGRAWRLRCPRCGRGRLFKNWLGMHTTCEACHLRFEREPGYFLGSIYINYGLTAVLATCLYFALFFGGFTTPPAALWIAAGFAMLFPFWFFRYARSLWMGFDHYWDPTKEEKDARV